MEALEFLKERERMCNSCEDCVACPLAEDKCIISSASDEDYKEIVAAVEKWSKEHPRKTRQSVFLEQWPEANLDVSGAIDICPAALSSDYRSDSGGCKYPSIACIDCRREFWMQEVE